MSTVTKPLATPAPPKPKDYKSALKPIWCPGCGDFAVLNAMTKAFAFLELPAEEVALITDGRFSGGTTGLCVGHVAPESEVGGPIGLVEDGDRVRIESRRGKVDMIALLD